MRTPWDLQDCSFEPFSFGSVVSRHLSYRAPQHSATGLELKEPGVAGTRLDAFPGVRLT